MKREKADEEKAGRILNHDHQRDRHPKSPEEPDGTQRWQPSNRFGLPKQIIFIATTDTVGNRLEEKPDHPVHRVHNSLNSMKFGPRVPKCNLRNEITAVMRLIHIFSVLPRLRVENRAWVRNYLRRIRAGCGPRGHV